MQRHNFTLPISPGFQEKGSLISNQIKSKIKSGERLIFTSHQDDEDDQEDGENDENGGNGEDSRQLAVRFVKGTKKKGTESGLGDIAMLHRWSYAAKHFVYYGVESTLLMVLMVLMLLIAIEVIVKPGHGAA